MKQETIVSGIKPTNGLHIGNYLGALKQFVDIQNSGSHQYFFFLADLHALTVPFDPQELRSNSLDLVATYIAAGIDPDKSTIFLQSQVLEHATLGWIFNCLTPLGELERMTQYKDKASKEKKTSVSAGLLNYPTLMAADILLYKPTLVPVGDDQTQHLELTRLLARKFNNHFGATFPEPKNHLLKPLRIMSLKDPSKKMSKTHDEPLYLDDLPAELEKKIKKAVTATSGNGESLGAENLLYLLSQFGTQEHIAQFASAKKDGSIKYSEIKTVLAESIANHFADFREKKKELLARPDRLAQILGDGAHKAREVASATLTEVKQKIGLL